MSDPERLMRERVRAAIDALPEPTWTVYRRHLFEAIDYRSIGDELDMSVEEVEQHLAQAIVLIDRRLR